MPSYHFALPAWIEAIMRGKVGDCGIGSNELTPTHFSPLQKSLSSPRPLRCGPSWLGLSGNGLRSQAERQ